MKPVCINCGKPFTEDNVFTPDGWREIEISQLCEICFDEVTKRDEDEENAPPGCSPEDEPPF